MSKENVKLPSNLYTEDNEPDYNEMERVMNRSIAARNEVQYSDFKQFLPIYKSKGHDELELRRLAQIFFSRFSLQHPIKIYNGKELIITLPPILIKGKPINESNPDENIMKRVNNSILATNNNPLMNAPKQATAFDRLRKAVVETQIQDADTYKEFLNILDNFKSKTDRTYVKTEKEETGDPEDYFGADLEFT